MGNPISAKQAHEWGIVDQLIEGDLLTGAIAFAKSVSGKPPRKTREITDRLGDPAANAPALAELRKQAAKACRGMHGAPACDRGRRSSGQTSFEEGCKKRPSCSRSASSPASRKG